MKPDVRLGNHPPESGRAENLKRFRRPEAYQVVEERTRGMAVAERWGFWQSVVPCEGLVSRKRRRFGFCGLACRSGSGIGEARKGSTTLFKTLIRLFGTRGGMPEVRFLG